MEEKVFSSILSVSDNIARSSKVELLRETSKNIVQQIFSSKSGVFIVAGVRGSGKTTILGELYEKENRGLFVNAEIMLKYGIPLLEFLHYAKAKGYDTFMIDEIHVLPDWEKDIKIFYDETKEKIIVSGSSAIALKVKGSELSRRATFYESRPLSLREYIHFRTGKLLPKATIADLTSAEKMRAIEKAMIPYINYYRPFSQFDALPAAFFEKNKDVYINVLERTVRYDLAYLREIDSSYVENVFRAMKLISTIPPGELSYSGMASSLGVGIKLAKEIVNSLNQTGLIYKVPPYGTGKKAVRKEEKILMPLSFRSALCGHYGVSVPKGSLREDFFIQHVGSCSYIKNGIERRTPDFVVGDHIFEVGGPSKGYGQISSMKSSSKTKEKQAFLVKEAVSLGKGEIPLYLFGLLY